MTDPIDKDQGRVGQVLTVTADGKGARWEYMSRLEQERLAWLYSVEDYDTPIGGWSVE